jgi:hypothetical protein
MLIHLNNFKKQASACLTGPRNFSCKKSHDPDLSRQYLLDFQRNNELAQKNHRREQD